MSGEKCRCRYDLTYHREFNIDRGLDGDRCYNESEVGVGLCAPCLFGCAP